ncbi:MAG: hypothetical protein ACLFM4_01185 [Phormidium sp.]
MQGNHDAISEKIEKLIVQKFPIHPLSHGISAKNIHSVLTQYFAMSQAFPYLQAGAQKKQILAVMDGKQDIDKRFELTTVVGNFLCWDETGGHAVVRQLGNSGLPKILDTNRTFHANMLRKDIQYLTGCDLKPDYTKVTLDYLKALLAGLESLDHIKRCAYMVAFESHAGIMIDALWGSISRHYNVSKGKLLYFKVHVGGSDPAEPYHIEMTERMVNAIVPDDSVDEFVGEFTKAYVLNYNWCESIKHS